MASIQIPNLPAVIGLDGSELFEGVQAGTSVKISLNQVIAAVRGGTPATLPIPVSLGGTGLDTFAVGDIMYASATQTFSKLADVATGNAIISGGVGAAPSYGKIGLTTHVSGVLPVANGGTNQSAALTQYGVIYGDTTTSMASSAAGTATQVLHGNAAGAPTWSAVSLTADVSGTLPVANGGTGVTTSTGTGSVVLSASPALTGNVTVASNSASAALTVTQTGAGNALVVEDSASPDSTPFVVDASGNVGIGTTTPSAKLDVVGSSKYTGTLVTTAGTDAFSAGSGTGISTRVNALFKGTDAAGNARTGYIGTNIYGTDGSLELAHNVAGLVMTLNSSGNVGIGVTPSAWGAAFRSLQVGAVTSISTESSVASNFSNNGFYGGNWTYLSSGLGATNYSPYNGAHRWFTAPSGTAGNAITFTERFRIADAGQLGIGGANYGTSGQTIVSAGSGAAPAWGTLPLAGGGTGATTGAGAFANLMGYTTTATAGATTTLTNTSTQYQLFTGTLTQTVQLPVTTSAFTTGWTFHIVNNSTGNLTVNASTGALVCTIIPQMTAMVTCISTSVTDATAWEFGFTDFGTITGTGSVVLGTGPTITSGVYSGTVGASSPSTGAFTTVTASTSVLSTGAGGIGYATGAGVAVTQGTSRTTTTPTTGAKTSGAITLFTAAPVLNTYFSFTVPNTAIAVTDTVVLSVRGATNTYVSSVTAITAATSFQITMVSILGVASDTPIVNFTIIKGVSA